MFVRVELDRIKHKDSKREQAMKEHRLKTILEGKKATRKFRDPMELLKG